MLIYMLTNYAGSLAAIGEDEFHYGVNKGALIQTSNLLSVIYLKKWCFFIIMPFTETTKHYK